MNLHPRVERRALGCGTLARVRTQQRLDKTPSSLQAKDKGRSHVFSDQINVNLSRQLERSVEGRCAYGRPAECETVPRATRKSEQTFETADH